MINKNEVSSLSKFQTGGYFVTSLYLNVDGRRFKKKDYEIKLKAFIKDRKLDVDKLGLNQEAQKSVLTDFEKIYNFINLEFDGKGAKSLAVFCCSGLNFWKVFTLQQTIHPRLVVSKQVFIRPLEAMITDNKQYFAILVSRDKARLFEYNMRELLEHSQILDEVPGQVKMAGWYGLEERRIERHIEDYVHRHFKKVAEGAFNYYQNNTLAYFIIGGRKEIIPEFERHLHSNIRNLIKVRIKIDVEAPISELTSALETAVYDFENNEERRMINKLLDQKGPDGLGISGLKATLRAMWHGQVHTLFIPENYSRPGYYCPECWFMSNNEELCANDNTTMKRSHDIIEDLIETAMYQNCEIVRLKDKDLLAGEHEYIGALLRFKI